MDSEQKKKVLIVQIGAALIAVLILVVWILNLQNVWRADKKLVTTDDSQQWLKMKNDLSKTLDDMQNQLLLINKSRQEQEDLKNKNFLSDLVEETKKLTPTSIISTSTATSTNPAPPTTNIIIKPKQNCPEWINCMPSIGEARPCKIPAGCEGITQIAY